MIIPPFITVYIHLSIGGKCQKINRFNKRVRKKVVAYLRFNKILKGGKSMSDKPEKVS